MAINFNDRRWHDGDRRFGSVNPVGNSWDKPHGESSEFIETELYHPTVRTDREGKKTVQGAWFGKKPGGEQGPGRNEPRSGGAGVPRKPKSPKNPPMKMAREY